MTSSHRPINHLVLGLILFFAITTLVYIGAYVCMSNNIEIETLINYDFQYRQQLLEVLSGLKDAEIGARGYALTGKRTFLQPYEVAIVALPGQIRELKKTAIPSTTRKEEVFALESKLGQELVLLKKLIELKANDTAAENLTATLEQQKNVMDDLRSLMTDLDGSALTAIKSELPRSRWNVQAAYTLFPFLGVIGLIVFVFTLLQFRRELRMQEELTEANKSLTIARDTAIQASLLKSQFVANISHELRTPLAGILGMSELLVLHELDAEAMELSDSLLFCAKHLLKLVNALLDFSKLEADKVSLECISFQPSSLVTDAARLAETEAGKKDVTVLQTVDHNCPQEILGDLTRTRQVLMNLVDNAVKFTEAGTVTISAAADVKPNFVRFSVQDTGIGIPVDQKNRLFEPFVQGDGSTTRKYGGTGLGLSICKKLVHLMGGDIGFEGELGTGCVFWFTVPIMPGSARTAGEKAILPTSNLNLQGH
jgi:two-component system, sensor histidine kinase and response regulator